MAVVEYWTTSVAALLAVLFVAVMMDFFKRKNQFPVKGKTLLITGGSQGMGKACAKILAQKGANVCIVARNVKKLENALVEIKAGASAWPESRFHSISADLTDAKECQRVLTEVKAWNNNQPPDVVWCLAGSSYPAYFLDMEPEQLRSQMDSNYWSSAYIAHATLKQWLAPSASSEKPLSSTTPRHLIFTSSVVAFYTIAGYSAYSPTKAALRSLCDTLRQEAEVYNGSRLHSSNSGPSAPVKLHTVFPATIFSPGYEQENLTKPAITKKLEEDDGGQTEEQAAMSSIKSLEKGEYLITSTLLGYAMKAGGLGGSPRNNTIRDTIMSWIMSIAWLFVGPDLDGKVWKWGKEKGHPQSTQPST